MKNFRLLLFWEVFLIGFSIVIWSTNPSVSAPVSAILAFTFTAAIFVAIFAFTAVFADAVIPAFAVFAGAATVAASAAVAALTLALVFALAALAASIAFTTALKLQLRYLPIMMSVAVEFTAIFLLFNYDRGWLAAVAGIVVLFGIRSLPEQLVVRPVAASR